MTVTPSSALSRPQYMVGAVIIIGALMFYLMYTALPPMKPQYFHHNSGIGNNHRIMGANDCPYVWNGGAPGGQPEGSCWCGRDNYCMCTPALAIDTIIENVDDSGEVIGIVFVRRKDNHKLAMVGGFVDVGETTQDAVRREVKEETHLEVVDMRLIPKIYDDPKRDARRHTVSVVYVARVKGKGFAGDDAEGVVMLSLEDTRERVAQKDFAFDHYVTIGDYLDYLKRQRHWTVAE